MKNKKYVTMKDIANIVGVSVNTVSRALNDKSDISEETKKKILDICEENGYVRNSYASMLRSNKSCIIGVVMEDSSNPFFSEVLKGMEAAARKNDYQIILMNSEGIYKNEAKAVGTLLERRVDGILVCPVQGSYDDLKELCEKDFPLVVVGRDIDTINACRIFSDEEKGGYMAGKHLFETGRKKPVMINDEEFNTAARKRLEGFKKAFAELGIEFSEKNVYVFSHRKAGDRVSAGYEAVSKLIEENINFDSLFCYNDLVAFGAMKRLKEENINIPHDVSVIGYDNISYSEMVNPSLTTINIKKYDLGYKAFNLLLNKIKNKSDKTNKKVLDVELIIRESTSL